MAADVTGGPPAAAGRGRRFPPWFWWALAGGGAAIVILVIALRGSGSGSSSSATPSADSGAGGGSGASAAPDLSGVTAGFQSLVQQNQQLVQQDAGFEASVQQQLGDLKSGFQQQQVSGPLVPSDLSQWTKSATGWFPNPQNLPPGWGWGQGGAYTLGGGPAYGHFTWTQGGWQPNPQSPPPDWTQGKVA